MAEITLSAGVRQNLLSLQNTAELMSKTQHRLATGKKVNSALDNPTNFFTAQSLQSRAGDMAALLDNMTTGIKTLEAADNGLTAITKTIESMQSTLRQARQDRSFKSEAYTIALPTTPTGTESLSFTGGAFGTTTESVSLTRNSTAATAATITGGAYTPVDFTATSATAAVYSAGNFSAVDLSGAGTADTPAEVTAGAYTPVDLSGVNTLTLTIDIDNAGPQNITLDNTITAVDNTAVTGQELADALDAQITGATVTWDNVNGNLVFTSDTDGSTSEVDITAVGGTAAANSGIAVALDAGADGTPADEITFNLTVDGSTQAITLDNSITAVDTSNVTAQEIADAINAQFGSNVASVDGVSGDLVISSPTPGGTSNVEIAGFAATGAATTSGLANADIDGTAAGAARTITFDLDVDGVSTPISIGLADVQAVGDLNNTATAAELAQIINTQAGANIASVVGGALAFTSPTTGATSTLEIDNFAVTGGITGTGIADATNAGADAGTPVARTVDELVSAINTDPDLKGKVRASNDSGRLRIENISTQEMEITGLSTTGEITGGTSTAEVAGNAVRANLVKQFNELRDQLDKLADDASYNGVNLLRGDLLKLTFNETGTSTIEIQAKDLQDQERPINTSTLGITFAVEPDFDSDTAIDARLTSLTEALGVIRSQSSAFGSNLSIVENRTQFTKSMINTLQTGADSLVLADTNEEAANMLALQTRQQLSSTALSLASQADQAVLRLF